MKIVFTPQSIEDLIRLREFLAIKNPAAAKKTANTLVDGIKKLKRFPYIGVQVNSAPDPKILRDLILGNYIVRYLILDKVINILRMWHHREEDRGGL